MSLFDHSTQIIITSACASLPALGISADDSDESRYAKVATTAAYGITTVSVTFGAICADDKLGKVVDTLVSFGSSGALCIGGLALASGVCMKLPVSRYTVAALAAASVSIEKFAEFFYSLGEASFKHVQDIDAASSSATVDFLGICVMAALLREGRWVSAMAMIPAAMVYSAANAGYYEATDPLHRAILAISALAVVGLIASINNVGRSAPAAIAA